jgi:hypothetical protein
MDRPGIAPGNLAKGPTAILLEYIFNDYLKLMGIKLGYRLADGLRCSTMAAARI